MDPSEVDHDVGNGDVPAGIKNAAIRKLEQELGIPVNVSKQLPIKFLTRLHYWAADTITHGKQSPWGEHEIDYVLFMTVPSSSDITIQPNTEEIDEIRWVTKNELDTMLVDTSNLFSPWFRLIYNKWIKTEWWENDITITMNTNKHVDLVNIHRFDPPIEHYGGGGNAGPLFSTTTKSVNTTTDIIKGDTRYVFIVVTFTNKIVFKKCFAHHVQIYQCYVFVFGCLSHGFWKISERID